MKIDEKIQVRVTSSLSLFLIQLTLIILVRSQLWIKLPQLSHSFLSLITISSSDILVAFVVSLLAGLLKLSKKVIFILHFILLIGLFLPVFFQIKMGVPLSLGLLSQIGGIFELKTSITDHSNARNFIVFLTIIALATSAMFLFLRFDRYLFKIKNTIVLTSIMVLACSVIFNLNQSGIERNWSSSFLLQTLKASSQGDKIAESKLLNSIRKIPVEFGETRTVVDGRQTNIILLILETFDYSLIKDPKIFQATMPNLFRRSTHSLNFKNHFTPWPFSSKALYSIMCGDYPYPGKVIDIRVRPDWDCKGWLGLLESNGYQLWAGYSGDLSYDRMGTFLNHQAKKISLEERATLSRFELSEWALGVDDRALLLGMMEFVDKSDRDKPFAATLIPINSHHPYWTPHDYQIDLGDSYRNSFHYQDKLIEEMFVWLEEKNLLDSTAVIITGDHGKREGIELSSSLINESMYHVPLMVFHSERYPKGEVTHATSHMDLKGTILELANIKARILKNYELTMKKDFMLMYDLDFLSFQLKDETQNFTAINLDTDTAYADGKPCETLSHYCNLQLEKIKSLLIHSKGNRDF